MYCKNCGGKIPKNAGFCGGCGAKVSSAVALQKPVSPTAPPNAKKPKKRRTPLIIALTIVVFLAIAVVVVVQSGFFDTPAPEHTVTFFLNDGTNAVYEQVAVADGESVEQPSDPTREGYTFRFWTAERPPESRQFRFTTFIDEDTSLYAQWLADLVTYTPIENGAGNEDSEISVSSGDSPYDDLLGEWVGTFDSGNRVWGLEISVYRSGTSYQATILYFSDAHARTDIVAHYLADVRFNAFNNRFELVYSYVHFKPNEWSSDVRLYGTIADNVFSGHFSTIGTARLTRVASALPSASPPVDTVDMSILLGTWSGTYHNPRTGRSHGIELVVEQVGFDSQGTVRFFQGPDSGNVTRFPRYASIDIWFNMAEDRFEISYSNAVYLPSGWSAYATMLLILQDNVLSGNFLATGDPVYFTRIT